MPPNGDRRRFGLLCREAPCGLGNVMAQTRAECSQRSPSGKERTFESRMFRAIAGLGCLESPNTSKALNRIRHAAPLHHSAYVACLRPHPLNADCYPPSCSIGDCTLFTYDTIGSQTRLFGHHVKTPNPKCGAVDADPSIRRRLVEIKGERPDKRHFQFPRHDAGAAQFGTP